MALLGAETDELEALAHSFERAGSDLRSSGIRLRSLVGSARWDGPDSRRFTRSFDLQELTALRGIAEVLHVQAVELRHQAEQQRQASSPSPQAPSPPGGSGGPTPVRNTPALALPAPPRSEDRYLGGVDLTLGFFTGGLSGDLVLHHLDDGRTRITLTHSTAAGASAGAGASADLSFGDDDSTAPADGGARAAVSGTIASVERQVWETDDAQVPGLLAKIAADQVLDAAPIAAGPAGAALGLFRAGVEHLSGPISIAPDPESTERLVQVSVNASAAAGLGSALGLGAGGRFDGTLRVGSAHSSSTRAGNGAEAPDPIIVEATSGIATSLQTALLRRVGVDAPGGLNSGTSLRLVTTLDRDGVPTRLDLTVTGRSGDDLVELRASARLDDSTSGGAAATVQSTLDHLRDGRVAQAADELGRLDLDISDVVVRTDTGSIDGTTARGSQSIGIGATVGIAARGQHTHLSRTAD